MPQIMAGCVVILGDFGQQVCLFVFFPDESRMCRSYRKACTSATPRGDRGERSLSVRTVPLRTAAMQRCQEARALDALCSASLPDSTCLCSWILAIGWPLLVLRNYDTKTPTTSTRNAAKGDVMGQLQASRSQGHTVHVQNRVRWIVPYLPIARLTSEPITKAVVC